MKFITIGALLLATMLASAVVAAAPPTGVDCAAYRPAVTDRGERILTYHSDIAIAADGSMDVTENICAWVQQQQIEHGIYRDFPTDYRDALHNHYQVGFTVLGATLDGEPAEWHAAKRGNGERVSIGSANTYLPRGEHAFTLHYRVTREIGFFHDHDELYWNVNGTGWTLPIEKISATVRLPAAVPASELKATGYTGIKGSRQQALTTTLQDGGAQFAAKHALGLHENLTIALSFPKGIVSEPSLSQRTAWLLHDNQHALQGLIGLALLWMYYLIVWRLFGSDPDGGPKIALYAPPDGDSAAALRFVREMGYDAKCFTAGVLGIAAKGGLAIERIDDGKYAATRSENFDASVLRPDEQSLYFTLFGGGQRVEFDQAQRARISDACRKHHNALRKIFRNKNFRSNSLFVLPGIVLTLAILWKFSHASGIGIAGSLIVAVGYGGLGAWCGYSIWRSRRGGGKITWGAWWNLAFFGVFSLLWLWRWGSTEGFVLSLVVVVLIATNVAFLEWMKSPTLSGARLAKRIDGFRWYLGVAERQELDSRYRPESNPKLFSTYLPYALALDVGNEWAERFAKALTPAQMREAQPAWYVGGYGGYADFSGIGLANFTNSLSTSLSGAIASATIAPGGGGGAFGSGGGFSGGGGGGGGGGGW
ncbi:MAG TPA: DUF2207 domain-containing protein [Rhodanobacteraceae bacterium]|nr:DUF2207 domain-containing protein [Rhodanobacteraceae bacterium]